MPNQRNPAAARTAERAARDEPLSMRQLEVFVALVEAGSFTAAAQRLGLSQPTVSGHVADLEKRIGLQLVERVRRGVITTRAGEVLLRPAREALRGEANLRHAAAELRGVVAGRLVVGGSTIPAVYLLPAALSKFRRAHPGVEVSIETGSSGEIADGIAHGTIEIGVIGSVPKRPGLRSVPVASDRVVLICPPDHPFADRDRVTRDEVLAEPLIVRPPGSGTRDAMLAGLGIDLERAQLDVLQIAGTDAVKAAVRAGLGVSFVSDLAVRDELAAGTLATVAVAKFAVTRDFHVVTRNSGMPSPAATAFRDVLLGEEPDE